MPCILQLKTLLFGPKRRWKICMVVDDKNKFIFVCIAKCASTSIRRRFGFFDDPPPEVYHMFLRDILIKRPDAKDYFKFAFVRNPYDRLYSTYINFKYDAGHFWAKPSILPKKTFKHFVMDFKDSEYSNFIHLQPQVNYLTVDNKIDLNFIGRMENLKEDFMKIEGELGITHKELGRERASIRVHYDPKTYDREMREMVFSIYENDFKEFGYEW